MGGTGRRIAEDQVFLRGLYYWGRRNGGGTAHMLRSAGWERVTAQLHPPPLSYTKTPPPRPLPLPIVGAVLTQTNIHHLVSFMLVDAWLLFFSKKVNFSADLHRKYIRRSAVALLETMLLWRSSLLLFSFMVA